ncbi:hypothetical protein TWF696_003033 [Orbilia brochopaga]|uniref:Uncharacterized protein n=1 Tax=Orbilia brochopaga TaxID=3140254 RepID=A0AAV9TYL9_9PEZI
MLQIEQNDKSCCMHAQNPKRICKVCPNGKYIKMKTKRHARRQPAGATAVHMNEIAIQMQEAKRIPSVKGNSKPMRLICIPERKANGNACTHAYAARKKGRSEKKTVVEAREMQDRILYLYNNAWAHACDCSHELTHAAAVPVIDPRHQQGKRAVKTPRVSGRKREI